MQIPDIYDLWERHEAEQEEALKRLPICQICGERIQDEYAFNIFGDWYHEDCYKKDYFKSIPYD